MAGVAGWEGIRCTVYAGLIHGESPLTRTAWTVVGQDPDDVSRPILIVNAAPLGTGRPTQDIDEAPRCTAANYRLCRTISPVSIPPSDRPESASVTRQLRRPLPPTPGVRARRAPRIITPSRSPHCVPFGVFHDPHTPPRLPSRPPPPARARAEDPAPKKFMVYVGTYTSPKKSQGIYRMELDLATGKLSEPGLAGKAVNPSFLAIHPDRQVPLRGRRDRQLRQEGQEAGGGRQRLRHRPEDGRPDATQPAIVRGRRAVPRRRRQGGQVRLRGELRRRQRLRPAHRRRTANSARRPASSSTRARKGRWPTRSTSTRPAASPSSPTPASTRCSSTASRAAS